MIEDAGDAAEAVDDWAAKHAGKLRIGHQRMSAKSDEVIAGRGPRADFLLDNFEHERQRHGAGAIGNDDENALALDGELLGGGSNHFTNFVVSEAAINETFADAGHDFSLALLLRLALPVSLDRGTLPGTVRVSIHRWTQEAAVRAEARIALASP
jgi:hypothetical protein